MERGTHAALLAQGGLYARLYREQFSERPMEPTERSDGAEAGGIEAQAAE